METCCTEKDCALEQLHGRQAATLQVVLLLNVAMFVVEFVSGMIAGSVALLADSLDMLGDGLVYSFSLYVVARGALWKARAGAAKAVVMGFFAAVVLGQLVHKVLYPEAPTFETMSVVGALALVTNVVCFTLLWIIVPRTSICARSGFVRATI